MSLILDIPDSLRRAPGLSVLVGHLVPEPDDLAGKAMAMLRHDLPPGARLDVEGELTLTSLDGHPVRGTRATVREDGGAVIEERMIVFYHLFGGVTAVLMTGAALAERHGEIVAMLAGGRQEWDDDVASLAGLLAGFEAFEARPEQAADLYRE